ncbi:phage gene 29 protein family protein [Prescottella equi]|uniref:phage gene 29 protein family protein n=1 Tax=Rhodococcus hoagii TaxID=43767 RepID=UPI000D10D04F|nr:DUF2744 domain-containing protein [Prescottella equi]AVP71349.1 hypothetical protein C7H75_25030 [Prescottella equi]
MTVPLQHECDGSDPRKAFVWALRDLPGPKGRSASLPFPTPMLELWSEHLWNLGFRHHHDEQTLQYQPGLEGGQHWLNPGDWVPTESEVITPPEQPIVTQMSPVVRAELARQLVESGELVNVAPAPPSDAPPEPPPSVVAKRVVLRLPEEAA